MIDFEAVPNPQRRALEIVREVAREKDCRPFLVGGPVRDILLGRPWSDVDLTLEDGTSTLARALAKKVDGRVRSFPQFLTYKVTADGLPEIDITTARKERYRKPGALPAVTEGRLKDDLVRRDFSVNAIAVDLIDGSLHDPTGGEHDLNARHVRILHAKSFLDDPTRIFRAIRLAERLGFTLEHDTAARMREAIEAGALGTVSRERLWRELFLAMDEAGAPRVLASLNEQGALEPLLGTRVPGDVAPLLAGIKQQLEANADLDRYVLFTGALLRGTDAEAAQLEGSGFSQKRARTVLQIANDVTRFEEALADAKSDRQRFRLFRRATPELLSVIAAERPAEEEHVARYYDYRSFKLALRGNDLEVPGGPHIAKALERTREAVFTGEIAADEAKSFAKEIARKYYEELRQ